VNPANPNVDIKLRAENRVPSRGPTYQVDNALAFPSPRFEMLSDRTGCRVVPRPCQAEEMEEMPRTGKQRFQLIVCLLPSRIDVRKCAFVLSY
jgi:hypothetical protein